MKTRVIAVLTMIMCIDAVAQNEYQLVREGNKYVCKGEITCNMDDKSSFGSAVLWALDNVSQSVSPDDAMICDVNKMFLSMKCELSDSGTAGNLYMFCLNITVSNGKLTFLLDNVKCVSKGVLAVFKTVSLDKINLEKKPQQKELIDKFAVLCSQFMQHAVGEIMNTKLSVNHWDAIVAGQVVKGMNANEVKLSRGKPININENVQRTIWTLSSGTVVMFENDIVSGVID